MKKLLYSRLIIFIFMLLIAFQSCAGIKRPSQPESPTKPSQSESSAKPSQPVKEPIKPESTAKPSEPTKKPVQPETQMPVKTENQAIKLIEAGEYQKAIDIYSAEYSKRPQDTGLVKEYTKGLENIKSTAEKALEKKDYAYAGRLYYLLQNNSVKFSNLNKLLSFDGSYLDERISSCVKSLSVQGFEAYRKGDISSALAAWQAVLAIDPENKAIKEAVKTAKQQQKNLQK